MPKGRYTIGGRGTHGCAGYPVVGDTGKVHGCHKTRAAARAQQAAIYVSESTKKFYDADSAIQKSCCPDDQESIAKAMNGEDPCWEGYQMVGWKTEGGKKVPNCVPKDKTSKSSDSRFEIVENHPKCEGVALVEMDGTTVLCYPDVAAAKAALADMSREEPPASVRPNDMAKSFWSGVFS